MLSAIIEHMRIEVRTILGVVDEGAVDVEADLVLVLVRGQLLPWRRAQRIFRTCKQKWPCGGQPSPVWAILVLGDNIQAVRRRLSVSSPEGVVASWTRAGRSRSRHAAVISASFSFSAGERSTTGELRRRGRLVELTERDTEREVLLDAMAAHASRDGSWERDHEDDVAWAIIACCYLHGGCGVVLKLRIASMTRDTRCPRRRSRGAWHPSIV